MMNYKLKAFNLISLVVMAENKIKIMKYNIERMSDFLNSFVEGKKWIIKCDWRPVEIFAGKNWCFVQFFL